MKHIPNILTILRIMSAFVFVYLLFVSGWQSKAAALLVFLLASLSDFLDGYLARKYNLITDFGKILDPVADKIVVLAAFLVFVHMGLVQVWMLLVIFLREVLITGIRIYAVNKGKILAAEKAGKHKTISQMVVIIFILLFITLRESPVISSLSWAAAYEHWGQVIITAGMVVVVILTVISGASFLKNISVVFARHNKADNA